MLAVGKNHLGGARGDEEHRVSDFALSNNEFLGNGEAGPQQLLHAFEVPLVEAGEEIEAARRARGYRGRCRSAAELRAFCASSTLILEVAIDLRRDQAPFVKGLVPPHLAAQRRLAQESRFERGRIVEILAAQRIERGLRLIEAGLKNAVDELADALAEDRARAFGGGAGSSWIRRRVTSRVSKRSPRRSPTKRLTPRRR